MAAASHRHFSGSRARSLPQISRTRRGCRLRHALHERTVFDQDDAGLGRALRHRRVLRIGGERLTIPLVRGEIREIDEREAEVGRPGELGRGEVADDLTAAALDGAGDGTRISLEVSELGGVERIADAQCEHDTLLSAEYGHTTRVSPRGTLRSSPNRPALAQRPRRSTLEP